MSSDKPIYLVSDDEEHWTYPSECETREEAIAEGRAAFEGTFWTGIKEPPDVPKIDAFRLLEEISEQAYEDCDAAEDWLTKVSAPARAALEDDLNRVFTEWMAKHGHQPNWFTVSKVQEHAPEPEAPSEVLADLRKVRQ